MCFILGKGWVVPAHIGWLHVNKVTINSGKQIQKEKKDGVYINTEKSASCRNLFCHHSTLFHQTLDCYCTGGSKFVYYLSGEIPKCLLRSPHMSLEYFLLLAPLILPMLWREQRAQGSPFPPNIINWSGLMCTAMYWNLTKDPQTLYNDGQIKFGVCIFLIQWHCGVNTIKSGTFIC